MLRLCFEVWGLNSYGTTVVSISDHIYPLVFGTRSCAVSRFQRGEFMTFLEHPMSSQHILVYQVVTTAGLTRSNMECDVYPALLYMTGGGNQIPTPWFLSHFP